MIVKKKQPRRIVLEEIYGDPASESSLGTCVRIGDKWWREVNEDDLSLHKQDDSESLRLSVDECKEIGEFIFSHQVNPQLFNKLHEFIKDKS